MRFDLFIELRYEPVALVVLYRDIADGRGDKGADGIDDDVLHRIAQRPRAPTSIVPSASMNFCMLSPSRPSKVNSYISHSEPIVTAKQKAKKATKNGERLNIVFSFRLMMVITIKPKKPEHKTAEAVQN